MNINELFGRRRVEYSGVRSHRWPDLFGIELELENVRTIPGIMHWDVHSDNSLRNGVEYVLEQPLGGSDLAAALNTYYNSGITCAPSERASTHIHINMQDTTTDVLKMMVAIMYIIEPALYEVVGLGRKWAGYSMALSEMEPSRLANIMQGDGVQLVTNINTGRNQDRYYGLNVASLAKHGTVEFRYFPGSPARDELESWLDLVNAIKVSSGTTTIGSFIEQIDTPEGLLSFLRQALPPVWYDKLMSVTTGEILFENFNAISALAAETTGVVARREPLVFINDTLLKFMAKKIIKSPKGIEYLENVKTNFGVVSENEWLYHVEAAVRIDRSGDKNAENYSYEAAEEAPVAIPEALRAYSDSIASRGYGGGRWLASNSAGFNLSGTDRVPQARPAPDHTIFSLEDDEEI